MKQNRFKSWALWTSIAALVVWCVKEFAGIDISPDMNAFLNVALPVVVDLSERSFRERGCRARCADHPLRQYPGSAGLGLRRVHDPADVGTILGAHGRAGRRRG